MMKLNVRRLLYPAIVFSQSLEVLLLRTLTFKAIEVDCHPNRGRGTISKVPNLRHLALNVADINDLVDPRQDRPFYPFPQVRSVCGISDMVPKTYHQAPLLFKNKRDIMSYISRPVNVSQISFLAGK